MMGMLRTVAVGQMYIAMVLFDLLIDIQGSALSFMNLSHRHGVSSGIDSGL